MKRTGTALLVGIGLILLAAIPSWSDAHALDDIDWEHAISDMSDVAIAETLMAMWLYSRTVTESLVVMAIRADLVEVLPQVVELVLEKNLEGVVLQDGNGQEIIDILMGYLEKVVEVLAGD